MHSRCWRTGTTYMTWMKRLPYFARDPATGGLYPSCSCWWLFDYGEKWEARRTTKMP